uniref:Regulatory inactivation of DnaA Hda protein n=1 Tax=Candidatus Kentrum sp. LFY TaxID=2126342 RepID=A0A450UHM6_9GAMM|nr:MAG: regulatory inactivation of DnaA Hda protein [Candidatus Kentron sp. LFY]
MDNAILPLPMKATVPTIMPGGPKQIPLPFGERTGPSLTNFIVGPNQEAKKVVSDLVASKGERVIYLWGEKGAGKSHLLRAAHDDAARQGQRVVSLSCRAPNPASANTPGQVRETDLDEADLVCIDDIDSQAENRDWEEALFSLYNAAEASGTRLLVAGQQNPMGADFSLADLGSRLAAGLVLRLRTLDDEGRRMALECRAGEWGFTLPDRIVAFLLRRHQRDMHSLFALLEQIDHETLVEKRRVTIPFLRDLLASRPGNITQHPHRGIHSARNREKYRERRE